MPRWRIVVFVHGCFWHGHEGCRYYKLPKTRESFWVAKIESNIRLDATVIEQLLEGLSSRAGFKKPLHRTSQIDLQEVRR